MNRLGWHIVPLSEFVSLQRGYDLSESERRQGNIPVIGAAGINGFHNQANVKGPGVVLGRSGAGFGTAHYCDTDFWAHNTALFVTNFHGNDKKYAYYFLDYLDLDRFNSGGAQPSLNRNFIYPIKIPVPPLNEQEAIVEILSTWDIAIGETERLVKAKEKRLKYFVNELVNNNDHPKVFARDITTELSIRNNGEQCKRVLSVTNTNGFVLPEDRFERRIASEDLSNYKLVRRGQYAYNPSRINVGSIARLDDWPDGVLSPMYVVFRLDENQINTDFFLYWLSSYEARERIKRSAQGSVRDTVGFQNFGDIAIPLAPLDTQLKIAELLNTAKKEIDLLKKQLEALRRQKHGLMQKLLTGEWRVKKATEEE